MDRKYTLSGIIMQYIPDFCWQDMNEIVTMVEQEYININPESVRKIVSNLYSDGELLGKPCHYQRRGPGGKALVYRKNSAYKSKA